MSLAKEKLRLAFDYIVQVNDALDRGEGQERDPWQRSAERQELKDMLIGARELLAELECDHPAVSAAYRFDNGNEITLSLPQVRAAGYRIEALLMLYFYDDCRAAIELAGRAIAIEPTDDWTHTLLAVAYSERGEFPTAIEAIERALSLAPDNLKYRAIYDQLKRRQTERVAKETPAFWRLSSWFS
jgi:tetratricopeptide (TPR) repeat protein